jgi:tetratricopeptide (TPR) repeat protein
MKARAVNAFTLLIAAACAALACPPALLAQQAPAHPKQSAASAGAAKPSQSSSASSRKARMTPAQRKELYGDIFMARKMFHKAIATYQDLLHEDPDNARLLNKVGIAYQQLDDWRSAERFYKKAGRADEHFSDPHNNLGTVEFSRKKYKSAIKQYKKAVEINPRSAITFSNLGYAYLARKKYNDAILAFRRAILLDPAVFRDFSRTGSLVEERGYQSPGLFYFMLAKTYATLGDARRCAHYLKMSREEGYKKLKEARTDPAFESVRKDPLVHKILWPPAVADQRF